ncbi:MAG TPA: cysteine desulfurase [Acidimicrobiales bacterium]|nr:cysteine desulfurase [Acidimicrobiales bacterium]
MTMKVPLDVPTIREDFPILGREVNGHRLTYLDSASSSQRPLAVLDAMEDYYRTTHANVHRGVYTIAEEATRRFEAARAKIGRFVGAPDPETEIVFAKNATEAINLVAHTYGRAHLRAGDAILLTEMEHHANLVPWLMLAKERDLELRYLPVTDDFQLDLSDLDRLVDGVKVVAVSIMSNVLGTINDVSRICAVAHEAGAKVVGDGSQLIPHRTVDLARLGCDFVAFTGHKMLGPTGIGCLWARRALLEEMPPFLGGGEMIRDVRLDGFTTNDVPWKFEAGTPPIAEAVGLAAAIDYLEGVGLDRIREHEVALTDFALQRLAEDHGSALTVYGPPATAGPEARGGVISISYKDIHPHDLAQVLDENGVCVRAGHHCAKPLMRRLGLSATARASLYLYNDEQDIDALSAALRRAGELFG